MGNGDLTLSLAKRVAGADTNAYLLVVDGDTSSIFHLPYRGSVLIGRAPEAELRVQHGSVSREHAKLWREGDVLRISDLESHNGTRVNGELLDAPRTLNRGDVISVGDVVVIVHFVTPLTIARAAYDESNWRRRLVEESERALAFNRSFAVVALLDAPRRALDELANHLRVIDAIGIGDGGYSFALLPEVDRAGARLLVDEALARLGDGATIRGGLAMCPSDACDADTLLLVARGAARKARHGMVVDASEAGTTLQLGERRVIVSDPAMIRAYALLEKLAASELSVLISGETGVGKENAAYALHHWSKRSGPFTAMNCAALGPESLVDSELFGHDKGAFTGAIAAKAGLFESAAKGTVFLDEVGELPLVIQAKLLRALETRTIVRVGETRERAIDVRLVAATNRSLEAEVAAGRFRQDLYFRLCGATVILPPLRDRCSEIALLARTLLDDACRRAGRPPLSITAAAMQTLLAHTWPGNVRELKNTMDYVAAAAPDDHVEPSDLPERLVGASSIPVAKGPSTSLVVDAGTGFRPIAEELDELERRRMAEALVAANGVKARAAQLIQMPIRTFTHKAKHYKL